MALAFEQLNNRIQAAERENCGGRPEPGVRRFGLLSPWSGGNLGNSAIISAVIFNLSKRIPGLQFVGLTLNTEQTNRRYGIEAFPLAAVSRDCYGQHGSGSDTVKPGTLRGMRVKEWLKRIPLIGGLLRSARMWSREIAHIITASRVVRRLDGVIIPGGGALDEFWGGPWGHPWSLAKWSILSRISRVPLLFVSVGKCSLERPMSRSLTRIALRLAAYRSYRDPESKIAVQSLITAPDDPVFPDLAFSYPVRFAHQSGRSQSRHGRLLVGVSPIAYCDPRVWPVKDRGRYTAYVERLAEIVKWLLAQGHQLVFFATDSPDVATIEDLLASVSPKPKHSDSISILPSPVEQGLDQHLERIAKADLVIASRLHGIILSHLVAVPTLAISYDPKVDVQMRISKQTDYCLNIDTLKFDTFVERFETMKAARSRESAHLRSTALLFRQRLDSQYDQILRTKPRGR
jgi:polysaccharide pyruvyl transferase WcaK-like protein